MTITDHFHNVDGWAGLGGRDDDENNEGGDEERKSCQCVLLQGRVLRTKKKCENREKMPYLERFDIAIKKMLASQMNIFGRMFLSELLMT